MTHQKLIKDTLWRFTAEQLNVVYVDSSLGNEDQEKLTLAEHIINCSVDWTLRCYSRDSDQQPVKTVEDMLFYIKNTLKKPSTTESK